MEAPAKVHEAASSEATSTHGTEDPPIFTGGCAGHDSSMRISEKGDYILKPSSGQERPRLEELMQTELKPFVPDYSGTVTIHGQEHVLLQNLLYGGQRPYVMDLKMGTRTFKDSECTNLKLRMDLLEKMVEIDPNEPSEEERRFGITKLRYMSFRERVSSSATMGFRFDGIRAFGPAGGPDPEVDTFVLSKKDTVKICSEEQIADCLRRYLDGRPDVKAHLLERLREVREALRGSQWFAGRELIGSSLLFVYDRCPTGGCATGVWMIDFANSNPLSPRPEEAKRSAPLPAGAEREDGYLMGLDNLIAIWQSL